MRFRRYAPLAAAALALAYALGLELFRLPRAPAVPPGVERVAFGDLAGLRQPGSNARPGDYLKGVPRAIRDLDQRRVLIQGFMIPTEGGRRGVEEFLLVRSQATCCFGIPPTAADVVAVHMAGPPVPALRDRVINVVGRLHVTEQWAGPMLGSLFQLDGETVAPATTLGDLDPLRALRDPGRE
jgi:hypothetical protein